MKIADLSVMTLHQPIAKGAITFKFGAIHSLESVIVRVTGEDGQHGYGVIEATPPLGLPPAAIVQVVALFRDCLIGELVAQHAEILSTMRHRLFDLNFSANPVFAAIDCALHDLAARAVGQPLSQYLGGPASGKIRTLDVIPLDTNQAITADVRKSFAAGTTAVKLKLTGDTSADLARVAHVRNSFGPELQILCDANGAYARELAAHMAQNLAALGVAVFEQPIPGKDLEGMATLTASATLPIEADESVRNPNEADIALAAGVANILSFRISRFGSISETIRLARTSQQHNVSFRFGAMFTPCLQNAFSAHLALALPVQPRPHELSMHKLFLDDPFDGFTTENGHVIIDPSKPGTGLSFVGDPEAFVTLT